MMRHGITVWGAADLPKGYRAAWGERGRLCVAKLAGKLAKTTQPADFPRILLKQGASSLDDEFVEVHILGPMTIRTLSEVMVHKNPQRKRQAKLNALREKLAKWNVACKVEK
jgi:hypothetical protein